MSPKSKIPSTKSFQRPMIPSLTYINLEEKKMSRKKTSNMKEQTYSRKSKEPISSPRFMSAFHRC
jgi:hypothetical protein